MEMQNPIAKIALPALLIFVLAGSTGIFSAAFAQEKTVNIYFFNADGCPHCAKELVFLKGLEQKYDYIKVVDYEVKENRQNADFLRKVGEKYQLDISHVPITIVGDLYFIGWDDDSTSGVMLEQMIQRVLDENRPDIIENYQLETLKQQNGGKASPLSALPEKVKLPFVGAVDIRNFSLPVATIVLGALDGFNPCAMWVLVLLIGLLLGMKNRKRMWILGLAFIITSAAFYFALMAAWLNLLLFIGFVAWLRIFIGIVALVSGGHQLKEYFTAPPGVCEATDAKQQQKILDRAKKFVHEKSFWLALGGMVSLAVIVNFVEAVCSAGLPVIYTQILTLAGLPVWQYYAYLLLYIFVFMLDDLIIFFGAMLALRGLAFTGKYSRFSRLVGGILMLIIGALLLFRPEWLIFS